MSPKRWPEETTASRALHERAIRVMPGGNTRATVFAEPYPLYAVEAEGAYVIDADGVSRLDCVNNYTALIHGHRHPEIMDRLASQMHRLGAVGMPTETEIALAELLCARAPGFEQIRFMNSGTEAVMTAIRAARAFTNRPAIAKCEGAYHGSYDYAEVSQEPTPSEWGDARPNAIAYVRGTPTRVLDDVVVIPFNHTEQARAILEAEAPRLACVVVDPLPSRVGLVPAQPAFLAMLRDVTQRHGIVLVFDEVISFRLGHSGAQGLFGVRPDLTALAKIIGGGMPVGAVAGAASVMRVFDPRGGKPPMPHGGTFNANPLTMVAGHAAMSLLTRDAYAQLDVMGDRLRDGARAAFAQANIDGQVTGLGSLAKLHLRRNELTDYRSALATPRERAAMAALHREMLNRGVLISPSGLINLSTAMGDAELDLLLDSLAHGLRAARGLLE